MASTAAAQPFQGSFLFVNHDAKHMRARPHRHEVHTHVQAVYHGWKRREGIRQLRTSARLPIRQLNVNQQSHTPEIALSPKPNVEQEPEEPRPHSPVLNPITILQKGNSDPFNAVAIKINPIVNKMLQFGRENILPQRFPPEYRSKSPLEPLNRLLRHGAEALYDPACGYGWLSIFTMTFGMISRDAEMPKRALVYKTRGSEMLRKQLAERNWHHKELGYAMLSLYSAELAARDLAAATMHARILGQLIEKAGGFSQVDLWLLENCLLVDAMRAIVFISRSPFAFPDWKLIPIDEEWGAALGLHLPRKFFVLPVTDRKLQQIMGELKEVVEMDRLITSLGRVVDDGIFRSMQIRRHICQARLTNHYLDLTEAVTVEPDMAIRAATSMAALYWSRMRYKDLSQARTTGFPLMDLQKAISGCEFDLGVQLYPTLWLWILYVGAEAEQIVSPTTASNGWHNVRFATQARQMGLRSWSDIRAVLSNFLYSDSMKPNGSEWWWQTMAASLDLETSF